MTRRHRRRGHPVRRWLIFAVIVLAAAWTTGFFLFMQSLPTKVADEDSRTDAIVVLTGGSERLVTGIALLGKGLGDHLFLSGVHKGVAIDDILRAAHVDAADVGDLARLVSLGHDAEDTVGNAEETARWAAAEGVHSIRLVTASYHMPRSLWEFHRAMPGVLVIPHPVFPDRMKADQWWRSPTTAALLAGEYSKYGVARIRDILRKGEGW